jgi:hypothetical protein
MSMIKNLKILLILIGSILLVQGCATTQVTKINVVATKDQKIGYDGTVTSQKKNFVTLSLYTKLTVAKDKTLFMLVIENGGEEPIKISNDNISVTFEGDSKDWASKKINVQSFDEFMNDYDEEYSKKEKKYIYTKLYDIKEQSDLSSMMSSSSSSSSGSGSSSSSSGGGGSDVEGMIGELNNEIKLMRDNNELLREALQEVILKPQTISPGNSYTGIVSFDTRTIDSGIEGNFQVAVMVGSEIHKFTFSRSLAM